MYQTNNYCNYNRNRHIPCDCNYNCNDSHQYRPTIVTNKHTRGNGVMRGFTRRARGTTRGVVAETSLLPLRLAFVSRGSPFPVQMYPGYVVSLFAGDCATGDPYRLTL